LRHFLTKFLGFNLRHWPCLMRLKITRKLYIGKFSLLSLDRDNEKDTYF
jgi:hypothetical protein